MSALLPRDVIWRALVIVVVIAMHFTHMTTDAVTATLISAGLLLLATLPQRRCALVPRYAADRERTPLTVEEKREF